jgi:hypothetical protein
MPRLAFAAAFSVLGLAGALLVACGDGEGSPATPRTNTASAATATPPARTPTPAGNDAVEPLLAPPVSQFVVLVQDLGIQNFLTDLRATRTLSLGDYAATLAFSSEAEGRRLLETWGFVDGYTTGLQPEGGNEAILQSAYVVFQELVMFESASGARQAFAHLAGNVQANTSVEVVETPKVANESIASRAIAGKIGTSNIDQALHQVVFRRGNVVVRLVTGGAAPLMTIDTVLELAAMVDEKLLDRRPHPEPTPTPPRSPSPAATPAP